MSEVRSQHDSTHAESKDEPSARGKRGRRDRQAFDRLQARPEIRVAEFAAVAQAQLCRAQRACRIMFAVVGQRRIEGRHPQRGRCVADRPQRGDDVARAGTDDRRGKTQVRADDVAAVAAPASSPLDGATKTR